MIIDYSSTAAYICPECSGVTAANIDVFGFSARKAFFRCSDAKCGANCVSARRKNLKYIFEIRCPICGETHSFPISADSFWKKDLLTFLCPVSDTEIFFKGKIEDIKQALDDLAARNNISDEKESLLYDMLEEIYMLDAENAISCSCGNKHIDISTPNGAIALLCPKCGAVKIIDVSTKNYRELCSADSIIIKNSK